MSKFYVVIRGKETGIYKSWDIAKDLVTGYPGAVYKSFATLSEADFFLKKSTIGCQLIPIYTSPIADKTLIYTDGSFKEGCCGYGVIVITPDGKKFTAHGRVPDMQVNDKLIPTNNLAEIYAIYVALSLITTDVIIYSDSRYAINCLTTYYHDWQFKNNNTVPNYEIIRATFDKIAGREVNFQHVPAHNGYFYNEEVDKLSNQGRLSDDNLIISEHTLK